MPYSGNGKSELNNYFTKRLTNNYKNKKRNRAVGKSTRVYCMYVGRMFIDLSRHAQNFFWCDFRIFHNGIPVSDMVCIWYFILC